MLPKEEKKTQTQQPYTHKFHSHNKEKSNAQQPRDRTKTKKIRPRAPARPNQYIITHNKTKQLPADSPPRGKTLRQDTNAPQSLSPASQRIFLHLSPLPRVLLPRWPRLTHNCQSPLVPADQLIALHALNLPAEHPDRLSGGRHLLLHLRALERREYPPVFTNGRQYSLSTFIPATARAVAQSKRSRSAGSRPASSARA